ncbi:MotA/TolQ/ExbB proton channel [Syntrophomonas zehnderi OL-4]|uniref:MotA/TolQ/ExbB proton channel n=1 Tax=Syntrophomonas zehnderi OL-4 TaxID=690567 RepID=A0A0E4CKQ6_9FIRM|nr:flagellar motor protein [Syntrophomonas zehnderi]CQB51999.1 MotA/TolQ/ExbB proton channel [Syntrophomonas zehnderi OL-4]
MDLTTLIGLVLGIGMMILAFLEEGGLLGALLIPTAAMIVFGGTFGATIASFTVDELKKIPYFCKVIFAEKKVNYAEVLDSLVDTADKARREGLLSLESQLSTIENQFMARGLQLVIDGTDPDLTRSMLEMEIEAFENGEKVGYDMFNAMGGFAPTMGIIGTVMGMVNVLANLTNPDDLGPKIAVAFMATLYGIASANLLWIPFGTKIKVKTGRDILLMEMILEGILSIQAGENPRVIKEKLLTFLPVEIRDVITQEENVEMRM